MRLQISPVPCKCILSSIGGTTECAWAHPNVWDTRNTFQFSIILYFPLCHARYVLYILFCAFERRVRDAFSAVLSTRFGSIRLRSASVAEFTRTWHIASALSRSAIRWYVGSICG
jgi:hypothetical protein